MEAISLYIHRPFCKSKCLYCDFLSYSGREAYIDEYVKVLLKEIKSFRCDRRVKSVFIGGGTPSVIESRYIADIMGTLFSDYNIMPDAEITIEANPGTVTDESLKVYRSCGINRISFGLQAWQDRLLKIIGRIHSSADFVRGFKAARTAGFDNINCDLMFSLPCQSPEDFFETINNVIDLQPEHVSAYSLIIEEGTPFYDMYEKGNFPYIDEDKDRQMYWGAVDILSKAGYNQYEISNFAKEGKQCRHNLVYWRRGDYKGFGLGAASLINEVRLKNTENLGEYIAGKTIAEKESLTLTDRQEEFMFLGLRCNSGISESDFYSNFNEQIDDVYGDEISKLISDGLISRKNGRINLTKRGFDLANMVFVEFIQ